MKKLLEGGDDYKEKGQIPVVVVEATNSGPGGGFSTKSFILRMLDAIDHPVYSSKALERGSGYDKIDRTTESTLRSALERGLMNRKSKYLFIDEAQHVRYVSKNTMASHAVMDSWKCLAQSVGLVLVIVGAYPVLDVVKNSPHLLGRKHQVHLPRYHNTPEDLEAFAFIVAHFAKILPVDKPHKSLVEFTQLLHRGSLGCIGLLKGWLLRAGAKAALKDRAVNKKILEETAWSDSDLSEIGQEILDGEELLRSEVIKMPGQTKTISSSQSRKSAQKPFKAKPKRRSQGNRLTGGA